MSNEKSEDPSELVSDLIIKSERCVFFTGAGISVASGIPDFRSPGGIWSRYDPEDFTYQKFLASEENRRKRWRMFKETTAMFKASPNPAHQAISELEKLGKVDCVITQNVDNLHQAAGSSKVIELHGNAQWILCMDCNARFGRDEIQGRLEAGEEIPACSVCGGMLKSATVLFGEPMPEKETREAFERSRASDLFIVVGSSLVVQPAASMPVYAKHAGASLVIINLAPTMMDQFADVVIQGEASEALPPIAALVKKKLSA